MKTTGRTPTLLLTLITFVCLTALGCVDALSRIDVDSNFNNGSTQRPLAGRTVFLLNNSIASSEMEAAYQKYMEATTPPVGSKLPFKSVIHTRAGFMKSDGNAILQKYIIDSAELDSRGKATFRKLSPGDYWIYCIIETNEGDFLIWNVKAPVNFYDTTKVTISHLNLTFWG